MRAFARCVTTFIAVVACFVLNADAADRAEADGYGPEDPGEIAKSGGLSVSPDPTSYESIVNARPEIATVHHPLQLILVIDSPVAASGLRGRGVQPLPMRGG